MEKIKSFLGSAGIFVVMLSVYMGWSMYRQHQLQQQIQRRMQLQQTAPKGGVVMDQDGTIRWQD